MEKLVLWVGVVMILGAGKVAFSHQESPVTNRQKLVFLHTPKGEKAFAIADYPTLFQYLSNQYTESLVAACNQDTDVAFEEWKGLSLGIQAFAKKEGIRVDGLKLSAKAFWGKDGTLQYIAYDIKPQSRCKDKEAINNLLNGFIKTHQKVVINSTDSAFANYGSITLAFEAAD